MGPLLRCSLACLVVTGAALAQIRHFLPPGITVHLDSLAIRPPAHPKGARETVARPRPARARSRKGLRTEYVARPIAARPEGGYAVYSGFPALLDSYRTSPPDTGGAVGPQHVVTMLNGQMQIQSRSGELRAGYPMDLSTFWSGLGDFGELFDPRVRYDSGADRWMAACSANPGSKNAALLIGVSQSGDPGGEWRMFRVDVGSSGFWADYPVLGFNANWIVLSANLFLLPPEGAYERTDIYVFNKTDFYSGIAPSYLNFSDTHGEFSAVRDYDNSSPGVLYFVQTANQTTGTIRISALKGPPGSEKFLSGSGQIDAGTTWAESGPNDYDFAPQYGSWAKVDTGDSRLQNCVMRNANIWCTQTVFLPAAKPTRAAVQWFRIDPASMKLVNLERIEEADNSAFYAFPSIAVNRNGDVLIGFTRFAPDTYPDAGFWLRSAGEGAAQWKTVFKHGEAPYVAVGYDQGSNRWGDFSATLVDPLDDVAFWTIQEFAGSPTQGYLGRWGTFWARVVPPSAGLDCTYSISADERPFDASGGTRTLTVETGAGCPWMAAGDTGWLTVASGSPGVGTGTVQYSVAAYNRPGTLHGTLTVAGRPIKVTQTGTDK